MRIPSLRSYLGCTGGGAMIMIGVSFLVLMLVLGLVVDLGRLYAVQGKVQNASDAALLGAVATVDTTPLLAEFTRLFNSNFPNGYMGSTIAGMTVSEPQPEVYTAVIPIHVPYVVMNLFGFSGTTFTVFSQVTRHLVSHLELSMVLDNTGSMAEPAGGGTGIAKIDALKQASHTLIGILFGANQSLSNLHISVLPYNTNVNIGTAPPHPAWMQPIPPGHSFEGYVANRNSDCGPPNGYNDFTDAAPTVPELLFRVPYHVPSCTGGDELDGVAPMVALLNDKTALDSLIDTEYANGYTRINVGLMWGWFTVSPQWQGLWGVSGLPENTGPNIIKAIILMTDGQNTVFGTDDATTAQLCTTIKNAGISIYTIGFGSGSGVDVPLLQNCASQPHEPYFFLTPTAEDIQTAFQAIADDLLFQSIRLSQ